MQRTVEKWLAPAPGHGLMLPLILAVPVLPALPSVRDVGGGPEKPAGV